MDTFTRYVSALLIGLGVLVSACDTQTELKWHSENGYRWAEVQTGFFGNTGFKKRDASKTGIEFRNDVRRELMEENRHYLNGSGVAAADIDGDGLVDIYFARLDGPNRLYKNLGNYQFRDITEQAGVAHESYNATGVVFADVNSDSTPDLLITSLTDGNALYLNDGQGRFTLEEESGLSDESNGSHSMALADVNGDGLLDLYIANYKRQTARDLFTSKELEPENTVEMVDGKLKLLQPFDEYYTFIETAEGSFRNELGEADELYINRGAGHFERVDPLRHFFDEHGNERGLTRDWGLTATFRDANGDGLPDLYVANDFWTPDRFWINRGDGTFRLIANHSIRNKSFSSMGIDFSDINRDSHLDLVVTEMLSQKHQRRMRQFSEVLAEYEGRTMHNRNSVYLNRGDAAFEDSDPTYAQIAWYSGLEASEWSWATSFMDVDLDGFEDLIVATGNAYDYQDVDTQIAMHEESAEMISNEGGNITRYPLLELQNKIFANNGDLTFTDRSSDWGLDEEDLSMGLALADLNNDGDLDLIFNRMNNEAAVYENRSRSPRIAVRLRGSEDNIDGIGAKIVLKETPQLPAQQKEITSGGNYLSGSQPQAVFAADTEADHVLVIKWPDGRMSRIEGVKANRIYEIDIDSAINPEQAEDASPEEPQSEPLFADVSGRLDHTHHENEYDDYRFNSLLPQKMSRLGPGIAWLDVTDNGRDDLLIGSGKGGHAELFENRGGGEFVRTEHQVSAMEAPGDQTALITWREEQEMRIAIGSANYEQGNPNVSAATIFTGETEGNNRMDPLPGVHSTTGPLAAADVDRDGYVDLFVGGRFKPGQYPEDADSRLFRNEGGSFRLDMTDSRLFRELGLVTGAVFSDLTQNGYPDLLLTTEWGTLRLFQNSEGQFREITEEAGLDQWSGWWQGVATGDFNNDGLPDIIATNLGLNSPYRIRDDRELRLYYADFNFDGRIDIIDSYYEEEINSYVTRKKLYELNAIPGIMNHIKSHRQFAGSSIEEIFNRDFERIPYKRINTLKHMVFLNNGKGFAARPLPAEAQFSASFHAGVADLDNDGNEDLFISQNFFGFPKTISRQDAGRGLFLKGDGKGNFVSIPGSLSGLKIYGDQRGSAFADFNDDGRTDLAVSQNSGETKLFVNQGERRGIKVKLKGPPSNSDAVGTGVRLLYNDGTKGPLREIQAGSGYWSQNSKTQIMGLKGIPSSIEVRWFDGTIETIRIPEGSHEITITYSEEN